MSNLFGCGKQFYGSLEKEEDDSYITTEWVTIFLIPIFPVKSYRVIKKENSTQQYGYVISSYTNYSIIEELKLNLFQVFCTYIAFFIPLLLGIMFACIFFELDIDNSIPIQILFTIAILSGPIFSFVYAKKINRNTIGWTLGALLFPYLIPIILVLISSKVESEGKRNSPVNKRLLKAVEKNKKEKVIKLLKKGADINSIDQFSYSILGRAIVNRNIELAKLLIKNGADINPANCRTPLQIAIINNQLEMVIYLIAEGADVDSYDMWGYTPLSGISLYSSNDMNTTIKILNLLIENGADINQKVKGKIIFPKQELKKLIKKGAKVHIQ